MNFFTFKLFQWLRFFFRFFFQFEFCVFSPSLKVANQILGYWQVSPGIMNQVSNYEYSNHLENLNLKNFTKFEISNTVDGYCQGL